MQVDDVSLEHGGSSLQLTQSHQTPYSRVITPDEVVDLTEQHPQLFHAGAQDRETHPLETKKGRFHHPLHTIHHDVEM